MYHGCIYSALPLLYNFVCYVVHLSVCVTMRCSKHKTQCSVVFSSLYCVLCDSLVSVCHSETQNTVQLHCVLCDSKERGHFADNSQADACGEKFRVGYISRMLILSFQLIDKHTRDSVNYINGNLKCEDSVSWKLCVGILMQFIIEANKNILGFLCL